MNTERQTAQKVRSHSVLTHTEPICAGVQTLVKPSTQFCAWQYTRSGGYQFWNGEIVECKALYRGLIDITHGLALNGGEQ